MNNANQDNLWHELTVQGHTDYTLDSTLSIKTIMDTWTLKMGYPVVNIRKHVDLPDNSTHLLISQKWFLLNPMSKFYKQPKIYDTYKWFIPFTYTIKNELNFEFESKPFWIKPNDTVGNLRGVFIFVYKSKFILNFNSEQVKLKLKEKNENSWIIGNVKHAGFYRVNYDENNWNLLIKQLNEDDFNLIDETSINNYFIAFFFILKTR